MDRGAWWATVHRVAQSRTRLKWLSTAQHTAPLFMSLFSHLSCEVFLVGTSAFLNFVSTLSSVRSDTDLCLWSWVERLECVDFISPPPNSMLLSPSVLISHSSQHCLLLCSVPCFLSYVQIDFSPYQSTPAAIASVVPKSPSCPPPSVDIYLLCCMCYLW